MTQLSKQGARSPRQALRRRAAIDAALEPAFFKSLCDPTRARLLACLAKSGRACAVGELAACCAVDLSVVSRHLALLKRAGVLESRRHGRAVLYRVRYVELASALRRLADAVEECCPHDARRAGGRCAC